MAGRVLRPSGAPAGALLIVGATKGKDTSQLLGVRCVVTTLLCRQASQEVLHDHTKIWQIFLHRAPNYAVVDTMVGMPKYICPSRDTLFGRSRDMPPATHLPT